MAAHPHELRVGLGESFLGHLFRFGEPPLGPWIYHYWTQSEGLSTGQLHNYLSEPYGSSYDEVAWAPHVFAEYMYRVNRWFGVGVQTDLYTSSYRCKISNGYGDLLDDLYCADVCWAIMPILRFTYYRNEIVSLYSHIGLGYGANFELTDGHLDYSEHLPAFAATFLGVSVGKDHWFGTFELGSMNTAANFMFLERLFSLSVGYRL